MNAKGNLKIASTTLCIGALLGAVVALTLFAATPESAQKRALPERSEVTGFPAGADPLAGVLPPTFQDPAVPMISLPTHFQSRRVNCDNRCPDGSNSVVLADLKDPGCVRHIWILDAAGPRLKGKFSLEIVIDGAKVPQVSAPVKAFFGIMNDQQDHFISNSAFAVLPNPEAKKWINNPGKGNPGFNSFLPIPFGESCRITLHNPPGRHGVGMVDWHKYEQGTPLTALRLHADYRHYKPSAPKGNYAELANIEGAGFIHGINLGYDQVDKSDLVFHTGGMSILIDGETNPHAIRGHNAEDDFGIAWGFNKVNIAWVGCPWYEFRSPKDQSGSYYRFWARSHRVPLLDFVPNREPGRQYGIGHLLLPASRFESGKSRPSRRVGSEPILRYQNGLERL